MDLTPLFLDEFLVLFVFLIFKANWTRNVWVPAYKRCATRPIPGGQFEVIVVDKGSTDAKAQIA